MADLLSGFSSRSSFTVSSLLGAFFGVVLAAMLTGMLGVLVGFLAFFSCCCGSCGFRSGGSGSSRCGREQQALQVLRLPVRRKERQRPSERLWKERRADDEKSFLKSPIQPARIPLSFTAPSRAKNLQPVSGFMHITA
jgi:hypothetical protein